ncbi:MAG: slipin family protein [Deltaproteobacteria bacterium]|nr:slipin family protein [Deltaproteobacteria bacterium]
MVAAAVALVLLFKWVNVLREYERGVVFRLGRVLEEPKGPGLVLVLWPIDRIVRISLRTIVEDVPAQDVITRDNVSIKVNAVLYFRVVRPIDAVIHVERFLYATSQLAQTTLRSVLGMVELDQLLAEREQINLRLQEIVDRQTDPWGVKVSLVEVKHVDLPPEMKRAMARQAEAEREKRAKVIHADGEFLAARKLADAAAVMREQPFTLQLRYLQTLMEIASDRMSTVVFPVPVDTLSSFVGPGLRRDGDGAGWRETEEDASAGRHAG